jgi:hypothetical protein
MCVPSSCASQAQTTAQASIYQLSQQLEQLNFNNTPQPQPPSGDPVDNIVADLESEITFLVDHMNISEPKPEESRYMPYIY